MDKLLKFRIPVILVFIGLVIFLGTNIPTIKRDAGIGALLPKDNPDYLYSTEMEELFGSENQIVIGISSRTTIYRKDVIEVIKRLTDFLSNHEDVYEDDVFSISKIDNIRGEDGFILVEPLIEEDLLPEDINYDELRRNIESNSLFNGRLVSTDGRSTLIIASLGKEITLSDTRLENLTNDIRSCIGRLKTRYKNVEINLSGEPVSMAMVASYMKTDITKLFPFALIVVIIVLIVLLKRFSGVIAPVIVTLFSIVSAFGLKGIIGSDLTIAETIIPVMLIAIGCADGVHIASEFFGHRRKGMDVKPAIIETMRELTMPVIMTSVTTGLGFASLLASPGISIKNMGLFLTAGVMFAMIFSLFLIPMILSFSGSSKPVSPKKPKKAKAYDGENPIYLKTVKRISKRIIRFKKTIAAVSGLFLLISIIGVLNVEVESDEIQYFKKNNPLRQATDKIEKDLGGIVSLDIILEGEKSDTMKNPEVLEFIKKMQNYLNKHELVSYSVSIADYIERMNFVIHDNDKDFNRLPGKIEIVDGEKIPGTFQTAQLLLLY